LMNGPRVAPIAGRSWTATPTARPTTRCCARCGTGCAGTPAAGPGSTGSASGVESGVESGSVSGVGEGVAQDGDEGTGSAVDGSSVTPRSQRSRAPTKDDHEKELFRWCSDFLTPDLTCSGGNRVTFFLSARRRTKKHQPLTEGLQDRGRFADKLHGAPPWIRQDSGWCTVVLQPRNIPLNGGVMCVDVF